MRWGQLFLSALAHRRMPGLLFAFILALAIVTLADAQSGRRTPKRNDSPKPVQGPEPEPEIKPPAAQSQKPQVSMLVVKYANDVSMSSIYSNIALRGCVDRLKESPSLKVEVGKEMNRKEAHDYAKASTDIYVVWLELTGDAINRGGTVYDDRAYDLGVSYVVFTPGTGKVKTQGRAYQRPYRPDVGVPLPMPAPQSLASVEYMLRQAGRDAADRIMDAFGLAIPGR